MDPASSAQLGGGREKPAAPLLPSPCQDIRGCRVHGHLLTACVSSIADRSAEALENGTGCAHERHQKCKQVPCKHDGGRVPLCCSSPLYLVSCTCLHWTPRMLIAKHFTASCTPSAGREEQERKRAAAGKSCQWSSAGGPLRSSWARAEDWTTARPGAAAAPADRPSAVPLSPPTGRSCYLEMDAKHALVPCARPRPTHLHPAAPRPDLIAFAQGLIPHAANTSVLSRVRTLPVVHLASPDFRPQPLASRSRELVFAAVESILPGIWLSPAI